MEVGLCRRSTIAVHRPLYADRQDSQYRECDIGNVIGASCGDTANHLISVKYKEKAVNAEDGVAFLDGQLSTQHAPQQLNLEVIGFHIETFLLDADLVLGFTALH